MERFFRLVLIFSMMASQALGQDQSKLQSFLQNENEKMRSSKDFTDFFNKYSSFFSKQDQEYFNSRVLKYGLKELPNFELKELFLIVKDNNKNHVFDFSKINTGQLVVDGKTVVVSRDLPLKNTVDAIFKVVNKSETDKWSDLLFPKAHAYFSLLAGAVLVIGTIAVYGIDGVLSPLLHEAQSKCDNANKKMNADMGSESWATWTSGEFEVLNRFRLNVDRYCDPNWNVINNKHPATTAGETAVNLGGKIFNSKSDCDRAKRTEECIRNALSKSKTKKFNAITNSNKSNSIAP